MSGVAPGVVVVGTGFGCFTHVRALRNAGFDVKAIVGRDPEKTRRRAAIFELPVASTSIDEALGLDGVTAVTVATPPDSHVEIATRAVRAGKHIICEKPLARTAAEGRLLVDEVAKAGVVALLGTEFRFDAGQAALARAVQDGAIGEPRLATLLLHVGVLADPTAALPDWWADAGQGGGWLGAHGSQVIDQIRVALGDFAAVSAQLPHVGASQMTAEDTFVVQFELVNGCVGTMQSTCADRSPLMIETRVAGTRGSVWIEGLSSTVYVADATGTHQTAVPHDLLAGEFDPPPAEALETDYERMIGHGLDIPAYTRLADTFRAMIEGQPPPTTSAPATLEDGVAALEVLEAIRTAAAERRWVEVPNP
jgi:predicted dehydrogenase